MKENKRPLIIITGPTAVGKTDISIQLAKAVNGSVISADSMQVYKGMDIGTAKITKEEMCGVKHYLIDCIDPFDEFNVVVFQKYAKKAMEEIYSCGQIPVIVGGTGFYIQSVLYDIDFDSDETIDEVDSEYRKELYNLASINGNEYVHELLRQVDPASADLIHANNLKRVVRALEYYKQTGQMISKHNEAQQKKESPYNFCYFVLNNDRSILYERIDKRVDEMFEAGLVDEMKCLIDSGCTKDMVSMQGIGYKELFGYFDGEYDLERTKYLVKLDTRHFAKRQLTWFKREPEVEWMDYSIYKTKEAMISKMLEILSCKNITDR